MCNTGDMNKNQTTNRTATTLQIARIGTGTAWHKAHAGGDMTYCNNSGRPQRIHSRKAVASWDAVPADYAKCGRCFH